MNYIEELDALTTDAIKDIKEIHSKLIKECGKPPMVVYPNYPKQVTDLYDMPVKEFKTTLDGFTFKLSAIGIEKIMNRTAERYYIRGYTTLRRTYRRISLNDLDVVMLLQFTDHLKNFYN